MDLKLRDPQTKNEPDTEINSKTFPSVNMDDESSPAKIRAMWDRKEEKLPRNQINCVENRVYSLPPPGRELTGPANFNFWKFRMESVLESEYLMPLISLEIPRPKTLAYYDDYGDHYDFDSIDSWEETSKLVARWLVNSISMEIFNKFEEGKSFVYADETWALIEQTIEGQDPLTLNTKITEANACHQTEMRSASIRPTPDPVVGELPPVEHVESSCPPHTKITVTNSHGNTEDFFSYTVQDVKMKDAMFQVMLAISFWGPKVISIFADNFSIQVRLAHHFEHKEDWFLVCRDMVTMHGFHDVMDEDEDEDAQGAREEERIEDVKEVEKTEDMEESL